MFSYTKYIYISRLYIYTHMVVCLYFTRMYLLYTSTHPLSSQSILEQMEIHPFPNRETHLPSINVR